MEVDGRGHGGKVSKRKVHKSFWCPTFRSAAAAKEKRAEKEAQWAKKLRDRALGLSASSICAMMEEEDQQPSSSALIKNTTALASMTNAERAAMARPDVLAKAVVERQVAIWDIPIDQLQ